MKKLLVVVGASAAVGYVLGARAGRERYEQIRDAAYKVKGNPTVQEVSQRVADTVEDQAPVVKEKLSAAADAAVSKVKHSSGEGSEPAPAVTTPNLTAPDDVGL